MTVKYSFSNIFNYSYGEILSRVPLTILELSLASLLSPSIYGAWSLTQTIVNYGNFSHLGISSSLIRKEPRLFAKENTKKIKEYRSNFYGSQIIIIGLLFLLILFIYLLFNSFFEEIGGFKNALLLLSTIYIQQNLLVGYSSSINELKIKLVSKLRIFYSLIFLITGTLSGIYFKSITSLLISWTISLIITLILLLLKVDSLRLKPNFNLKVIFFLLCDGFPILFQGFLRFILVNIDRFFLLSVSTFENLGYYSIGLLAANLVAIPGSIITKVTLPVILRQISDTNSNENNKSAKVIPFTLKIIQKICLLIGLFSSIILPIIIQIFIPKYYPSILVCITLSFVGAAIGISQSSIDFTLSIGKKDRILKLSAYFIPIILTSHFLFWLKTQSIIYLSLSLYTCILFYTYFALKICLNAFKVKTNLAAEIFKNSLIYLSINFIYGLAITNKINFNYFFKITFFTIFLLFISKEIRDLFFLIKKYPSLNKN